jgi:hypothetical protein
MGSAAGPGPTYLTHDHEDTSAGVVLPRYVSDANPGNFSLARLASRPDAI